MTLIQGRSGRVYDSVTGQRVNHPVQHVEDRTPDEVRKAQMNRYHREQPSGKVDPDFNPIRAQIAEHVKHKGPVWADDQDGRDWIVKQTALADEWDAKRAAQREREQFQASIKDLTEFAQRDYESVMNDPHATVADTEAAAERLAIAQQGNRETYKQLHAVYRDRVLQRVAERAAAVESERTALAQKRDAILAEQLDAPPVEVPQVRKAEPFQASPPISTTHVSVTDEYGRSKIVRRDEI